uniref:Uncharacterized protein n=1 Tax=Spironucleus salmonicida TaxID=348837 RepID=V6LUA0_9EUKA|eukprot:EST47838.1 Hypothetical protein SS50377_12083 [Spironucleus salmonicida]
MKFVEGKRSLLTTQLQNHFKDSSKLIIKLPKALCATFKPRRAVQPDFTVVDFEAYATQQVRGGGFDPSKTHISEFGAVRVQNRRIVATIQNIVLPSAACLRLPDSQLFMARNMTKLDCSKMTTGIHSGEIGTLFDSFSRLDSAALAGLSGVTILEDFCEVEKPNILAKGPELEKQVLGIKIQNSDDILTKDRSEYHGAHRKFHYCNFHVKHQGKTFSKKGKRKRYTAHLTTAMWWPSCCWQENQRWWSDNLWILYDA